MKKLFKEINPHAMRMLLMAGNAADVRDAIRWEREKKQGADGTLFDRLEIDNAQMLQKDL